MFQVVLVCNEQITVGAVATGLVEREHLHWIDMDHQWQLPLVHLVVALRAARKPHILIGIEKEAVTRGLLAQSDWPFFSCYSLIQSKCFSPLLQLSFVQFFFQGTYFHRM